MSHLHDDVEDVEEETLPHLIKDVSMTGLGPEAVCTLLYSVPQFKNNVVAFKPDETFLFEKGVWSKVDQFGLYKFVCANEQLMQYLFIASEVAPEDTKDYTATGKWGDVFAKLCTSGIDGRTIQQRFDCAIERMKGDTLEKVLAVLDEGQSVVNTEYVEYLRQDVFYKPFGWKKGDADDSVAVQKATCAMQAIGLGLQGALADGKCALFIVGEKDTGKSTMLKVARDLFGSSVGFQTLRDLKAGMKSGLAQYRLVTDVMKGAKIEYLEEGGETMNTGMFKQLVGGSNSTMKFHVPYHHALSAEITYPASFMFTINPNNFLDLFNKMTSDDYNRVVVLRTDCQPFRAHGSSDPDNPVNRVMQDPDGYKLALAYLLKEECDKVDSPANFATDVMQNVRAVQLDRQWWLASKGISGGYVKPSDLTPSVLEKLFEVTCVDKDVVAKDVVESALCRELSRDACPHNVKSITSIILQHIRNNNPNGVKILDFSQKQAWHFRKIRGVQVHVLKYIKLRQQGARSGSDPSMQTPTQGGAPSGSRGPTMSAVSLDELNFLRSENQRLMDENLRMTQTDEVGSVAPQGSVARPSSMDADKIKQLEEGLAEAMDLIRKLSAEKEKKKRKRETRGPAEPTDKKARSDPGASSSKGMGQSKSGQSEEVGDAPGTQTVDGDDDEDLLGVFDDPPADEEEDPDV